MDAAESTTFGTRAALGALCGDFGLGGEMVCFAGLGLLLLAGAGRALSIVSPSLPAPTEMRLVPR